MLRDEEIARLREAAVADPTQTVRLCDLLVAADRAEEAVRLCRSALRDRPDDVDLRLALGRALSAAGNLEEAQAALFDAVARKRRNTRQNIPIVTAAGQNTPPPRTPAPQPHTPPPGADAPPQSEAPPAVVEPGAPTAILGGGTSRHILAPGRPLSGTPQSLRPLGTAGEAQRAPGPPGPSASRKLPPLGPPSQRPFGALPRGAPRFPLSGSPMAGDPPRAPFDDAEAAPPVPDLVTEELTGAEGVPDSPARRGTATSAALPHFSRSTNIVTPPPARRPDSAVTPPPSRRDAMTPAPVRRPDSAVTPPPSRRDAGTPAPVRRPDSAVTPPPSRRDAGTPAPSRRDAVTPAPVRRADSAVTPPPSRAGVTPPARRDAASGRPATGSLPTLPAAQPPPSPEAVDPLPLELQDPVLPLPQLESIADGDDSDEPSLVSEVLAAAASTAHHIGPRPSSGEAAAPRPLPIFDSGPAASAAARAASLPIGEPDEAPGVAGPPGEAEAPVPAALPVDLSPQPLLFDIEGAARRLLGSGAPPPRAQPPERDRAQQLFDQRRGRVFSGLWISVGLVTIGVLVGWATRTATTTTAVKRRLAEGDRLAATARYDDLRGARDLFQQAAQIAPHDALSLARLAEAEARLCADHGEGIEDSAFIRLRRAEHEAGRDRSGRAAAPLRRAQLLLALARGEPCPTLAEADEARSQREDGDVAARCALQRGDVPGSLRVLSGGGAGSIDRLLWRGSLALALGDLEEADHAYRTVLDLLPGHPRALLGRGMVGAERGGDLQAPAVPDGVALGVVGESWLQLLQGLSALRRGDEAAASAAFDGAGRGARYDARLSLWVGRARLDEGRVADAEAALRRAGRLSPSDPDLSVLDAEVALAKGHEDRVIRALSPVRTGDGREAGARLQSVLGRALYRAGRYREAADALDRALAARPGDVQARSYRLLCRARLGAERDAFHDLESLAAGPLPVTTPHYALAVLAYERKDLERAAAESERALTRNPEASWARTLRGRVLREQGKLAEAITELDRVSREAPALLPAHQILGRVYLDLGRYREARAELRQVTASGRATLEDYAALLDATLGLGLPAEAEQLAREARRAGATAGKLRRAELVAATYKGAAQAQAAAHELEADRRANARDVQLALQTAAAWLRAGDGQSALDVYESLRARAPLQALIGVGRAQLRLRKGEEAEAALRAALEQFDKGPYGKQGRAEAGGALCRALLLRGGQGEAALREAEAALRELPDLGDAHYCRGKVLNERGQVQLALAEARRAVELDPASMEACVLLGDVTYKSKQPEGARLRYQRCLEIAPNSPLARYVRGALSMIK